MLHWISTHFNFPEIYQNVAAILSYYALGSFFVYNINLTVPYITMKFPSPLLINILKIYLVISSFFLLPLIFIVSVVSLGVIALLCTALRVVATVRFIRNGVLSMPHNYRCLILCTSPLQVPEVLPGLEETASDFRFSVIMRRLIVDVRTENSEKIRRPLWAIILAVILSSPGILMFFGPVWFYRLSIKSTFWFWGPLAFLGGDLKKPLNPEVFRKKIMSTLWAKGCLLVSVLIIGLFLAKNLLDTGVTPRDNLPITPIEYLFIFKWGRPWEVLSLIAAVLSIIVLLTVDYASRVHTIRTNQGDKDLTSAGIQIFGWAERVVRLRLMVVVPLWVITGIHTVLYVNSQHCWFSLGPAVHHVAAYIYGDRLPVYRCPSRTP